MRVTKTTMKEWPADDRPREKCIQQGAETLSNAELLAILLRSGTSRYSALDISKQLLSDNGGLLQLGMMTTGALSKHHGMGPAKASTLTAAFQLGARFHEAMLSNDMPVITGPESVANAYGDRMRLLQKEVCKVILLNRAHRAFRDINVSVGSISASIVHPREVFKAALMESSASVIISHNHPSGDTTPSKEDLNITIRIGIALNCIGVTVHDHVIVGDGYCSMESSGYLADMKNRIDNFCSL